MRIACPACAATYDVPDAQLVPARKVRCARCGADWVPERAEAAPEQRQAAPGSMPGSVPEPMPQAPVFDVRPPAASMAVRLAAPRPPVVPDRLLMRAWLASILVLAALLLASFVWRGAVVRAWPASERAYVALGWSAPP